jgi:hypothetical protein
MAPYKGTGVRLSLNWETLSGAEPAHWQWFPLPPRPTWTTLLPARLDIWKCGVQPGGKVMNADDFANGKMLGQSVRQESIVVNRAKGQTVASQYCSTNAPDTIFGQAGLSHTLPTYSQSLDCGHLV